jgi:hypothetical protein
VQHRGAATPMADDEDRCLANLCPVDLPAKQQLLDGPEQ